MMAKFVELISPTGELVFINPDQVTQLKDKDEVTHIHFGAYSGGPTFTAVHLPIRDVAKLLSRDK